MAEPVWSDLLRFSERQAWERRLESLLLGQQKWILSLTTVAAVAPLIHLLTTRRFVPAVAWVALLAGNLAMLVLRDRPLVRRQLGSLQLSLILLLVVAMALSTPEAMTVWVVTVFVVSPLFVVAIRWHAAQLWTLTAVLMVAMVWDAFRQTVDNRIPLMVLGTVFLLAAAWLGAKFTRDQRRQFVDQYRRLAGAERDRTRMVGELADARAVQLSMLPQKPPEVDWLDIASVSIPASEVGGDYYDYIELDADRVALIVGDVSGHGMASGLVLAGVRTGLHLLRDELLKPVEALRRLDRAIRETSDRRMLVTLQIALVDRRRQEIVVANAGHPPLILASTHGRGQELGAHGPPLGTRLEAEYVEQRAKFTPGDRLLLYTDGVSELTNFRGHAFGSERLLKDIAKVPSEQGARALLDSLLSTLTHFKADADQEDDLTLIVVGLGS